MTARGPTYLVILRSSDASLTITKAILDHVITTHFAWNLGLCSLYIDGLCNIQPKASGECQFNHNVQLV